MKKFIFAAAVLATISSSALAGSPLITIIPEPILAEPENTWAGPYAGLLLTFEDGSVTENTNVTPFFGSDDLAGNMYGAFVGHNFQSGGLVYGGEVAYMTGDSTLAGFPAGSFTSFLDAKVRVGAAMNQALIYGFAGYSTSSFTHPLGTIYNPQGYNYGAGLDYKLNDNFFVGAEYIVRDLTDDTDPGNIMTGNIQSFQLRAGIQF